MTEPTPIQSLLFETDHYLSLLYQKPSLGEDKLEDYFKGKKYLEQLASELSFEHYKNLNTSSFYQEFENGQPDFYETLLVMKYYLWSIAEETIRDPILEHDDYQDQFFVLYLFYISVGRYFFKINLPYSKENL